MKKVHVEEGVIVSERTLRDSDLLNNFIITLNYYSPRKHKEILLEGKRLIKKYGDFGYTYDLDISEDEKENIIDFIYSKLFDSLQEISPKGCYFGTNEGDSSCYGYWKI